MITMRALKAHHIMSDAVALLSPIPEIKLASRSRWLAKSPTLRLRKALLGLETELQVFPNGLLISPPSYDEPRSAHDVKRVV